MFELVEEVGVLFGLDGLGDLFDFVVVGEGVVFECVRGRGEFAPAVLAGGDDFAEFLELGLGLEEEFVEGVGGVGLVDGRGGFLFGEFAFGGEFGFVLGEGGGLGVGVVGGEVGFVGGEAVALEVLLEGHWVGWEVV